MKTKVIYFLLNQTTQKFITYTRMEYRWATVLDSRTYMIQEFAKKNEVLDSA